MPEGSQAFVDDLARLLNPEQLEATITTEGPVLVLAGAGSGKTRVLVHRIAYLLRSGLARPWEIFAVTFTNKAAGEMRVRLEALLGDSVRDAWIGTFHALSARMLRLEGHRLGYTPNFTIYDDDDSKRLLKSIMEELQIDVGRGASVNAVAAEIDRAKNRGKGPNVELERTARSDPLVHGIARRVYPRYQEALRRSNAMDFGDLLLLAVELLRHHPEARARFSRRFRYVMVDEFQDTNAVQYDLLKLLVSEHHNLAVVGDDDQAIYRWRGAEVRHILGFEHEFPEAKVVKLERNYRSSANILEAANAVIKRNRERHAKSLRTTAAAGEKVSVTIESTSEDEATLVARSIAARVRGGERPEDFAILYRQNAQSRPFEESLRRFRVPFTLIGGTGFYERMEVKDILAYLRLTANPASRQDFERVINVPSRKIGEKTLALVRQAGEAAGVEGAEMLTLPEHALLAAGLKPEVVKRLRGLGAMFASFRDHAKTASASSVAKEIIEETGYLDHLERTDPQSAEDRKANVEELVSSIAEHEDRLAAEREGELTAGLGLAGARTPLEAFLDAAALTSTSDEPGKTGAVSLLTLHAAKGLEFPFVFMVGMEEYTFPSRRALEDDDRGALEEERRLCYVGMTRAMRQLFLVGARFRRIYGKEETRWPSRFLGELPDHIVGSFPAAGAAPAPAAARWGAPIGRRVSRGGDAIDYDEAPRYEADDAGDRDDAEVTYDDDQPRRTRPLASPKAASPRVGGAGTFTRGTRVAHNLFGEGRVEDVEGEGPGARLTIRFPEAGIRKVVARFVRVLGR